MYNQYIYSLLFTAIITFILAVFLSFQKTYRNLIKITFVAYCVCLVVWSSGQLLALQEKNYDLSLFFVRNYCHSGVIFIPVLFIHFIFCFLEEDFDRRKLIYSLYVIGGVVFFINQFTNLLVKAVDFYPPVFNYVFVPGILHPIYVAFFVFCAVWGNVLLYKAYCKSRGIRRNQIKYLLFAVFLSYLGGTPNFLLGYHIQVKILNPYGTYLLPVFVSIVTYAIIKYHLMDIRLAITQTGIFIAVYSIVLGVPFWLGFKYGVWQHSTWIMFLLATAGPIIYSYLKNHAEKRLLVDQKHYQWLLIQISKGLSKFKEVSEVIKFTTRTVPHVMKFTHGAFYYYDDQFEKYSIKSQFGYEGAVPEIFKESKLINFIAESEKVLLVEEQSQKITLPEWHDFVSKTSAECVVPVSHDKKLLGFLLLGKKKNNQMFTHDDVSMFEIFRDHLAVTIENCHFLERERKRTEEDGVHARRQQMDMMFHTLTHELDNPNAGILGSAELLLDNFSHYTDLNVPQCKAEFDHYLPEIIHNSKRLSKILRAFESYVKGNHEYKVVSPNEIYEEFQTLLNVLVKKARKQENNNVVITEEIEPNLPLINVVAVTIEEILMNFIENSIDAVKFNKDDKGKLITVKIFKYNARYVRFFVSDNGHGVFMDDIKETLFEVPTTSKGSSEGTGLGCYRVRKICEINNGKPGFFSEGKGLGAEFWVDIPIYDNPQPGELK